MHCKLALTETLMLVIKLFYIGNEKEHNLKCCLLKTRVVGRANHTACVLV